MLLGAPCGLQVIPNVSRVMHWVYASLMAINLSSVVLKKTTDIFMMPEPQNMPTTFNYVGRLLEICQCYGHRTCTSKTIGKKTSHVQITRHLSIPSQHFWEKIQRIRVPVNQLIVAWWRHMATNIWVHIGSGISLVTVVDTLNAKCQIRVYICSAHLWFLFGIMVYRTLLMFVEYFLIFSC